MMKIPRNYSVFPMLKCETIRGCSAQHWINAEKNSNKFYNTKSNGQDIGKCVSEKMENQSNEDGFMPALY